MTKKTVIVHDGRIPGGLGAVVLARTLRRCEIAAVQIEHLSTGQNARYFWTNRVQDLAKSADLNTKLILFGVTFYDLEDQVAKNALSLLQSSYGDLEVWSHRWPDGYSDTLETVHIPPQDIVYGPMGFYLEPAEKLLLRLSLISARAIPVSDRTAELQLSTALSQWVDQNPNNWTRLADELDLMALVEEARSQYAKFDRSADATIVVDETDYVDLEIDRDHVSYEIPIIDDVLSNHGPNDSRQNRVVIAWLGTDRVLITRRRLDHEVPSIRWLIDNRFTHLVPEPLRGGEYGPQDAVYYRLDKSHSRAGLRAGMRTLAQQLAGASSGGRYLSAALARDLAGLANEVFRAVDLTGQYTNSSPRIEVAATDLYDLYHTSSRTGDRRHTLVIPVRVHGPRAVAFFFQDGGYNFQKAERLLEGAVLGLSGSGVDWLGMPDQPKRLRLDINPIFTGMRGDTASRVRKYLQEPRVRSIEARGLVSPSSVIGKFLAYLKMDKLVAISDSETIGPSVAHALTLRAAADAVKDLGGPHGVLDLFAGSGVAHRLLSGADIPVISVDLFVSAQSVGLQQDAPGTNQWLRADARAVLDPQTPLIEGLFGVIGLDPPHSELLDLLFGVSAGHKSLVEMCSERSLCLVLYQGHSTQRGRLNLVLDGLGKNWPNRAVLQVEEELIVLAATKKLEPSNFSALVDRIVTEVNNWAIRHDMQDVRAQEIRTAQVSKAE